MLNFSWNRWFDRLLASPVLVYPFTHSLYHLTSLSKALQATKKLSPVNFLLLSVLSLLRLSWQDWGTCTCLLKYLNVSKYMFRWVWCTKNTQCFWNKMQLWIWTDVAWWHLSGTLATEKQCSTPCYCCTTNVEDMACGRYSIWGCLPNKRYIGA